MKRYLAFLIGLTLICSSASGVLYAKPFGGGKMCKMCEKSGGSEKGCCSSQKSDCLEGKFFKKFDSIYANQEEIGLSKEQTDKLLDLKTRVKKETTRQKAEIEVLKADIGRQLYNRAIDAATVNNMLDEKYKLKLAMAKGLVQSIAELKGLLTDEQYAAMKTIWLAKHK